MPPLLTPHDGSYFSDGFLPGSHSSVNSDHSIPHDTQSVNAALLVTITCPRLSIDFFCRNKANLSDVEYFLLNFSNILQFDDQEKDRLNEEFIDYKTVAICELPGHAFSSCCYIKERCC